MYFDEVKQLLADQLNIDQDKITLDTNIIEDLDADSLDVLEMLMSVEEHFGVKLSDEQAKSMKTVEDFVIFLENNVTE